MEKSVAIAKIKRLCSAREYCSAQIISLLGRWNSRDFIFNKEEIATIIMELEREGYISDLRFISAYARDKALFRGWGPEKILYKLKELGMPPAVRDGSEERALRTIVEQALDSVDTGGRLVKLLAKKWDRLKEREEPLPDKRGKLIRFALSRGYSYSVAVKTVAQVMKNS